MNGIIFALCVFAVPSIKADPTSSDVKAAFEKEKLVPDVLNVPPKDFLRMTFSDGTEAKLGNEVAAKSTGISPKFEYEASDNEFFTLIMLDPDLPSPADPKLRSFVHWLVVNIPGNKVEKGEVKSEYIPSAPGNGTGFHRYPFLLYKQSSRQVFKEPYLRNNSTNGRSSLNLLNFASLHKLGNPVKGNFYKSQYDESVPAVWKQIGLS